METTSKRCPVCDVEIPDTYRNKDRKFCSAACYGVSQRGPRSVLKADCRACGKPIDPEKLRHDRTIKYCSHICRGIGQRKRERRQCPQCGKEFVTQPADKTVHCSHACRAEADKVRIVNHCRHCGKDIETKPSTDQQFCNRDCYHASMRKPPEDCPRRCTKCGIVKHPSRFANPSWCKRCSGQAIKAWRQKPENRHKYAVNDARKRGLEWTITLDEHLALLKLPCHYCGGPLNDKGTGLDRTDNVLGYYPTNVVPCCGRCNRVKHHYFTYEEMLIIGETIRRIDAARTGGP
jgi:hypothetical protein